MDELRKRLQVQTYDIAHLLNEINEVNVTVGRGWFASPMAGWEDSAEKQRRYQRPDGLLAELQIMYADGTTEAICTAVTWQYAVSPIRFSEIYDGETYNATVQPQSWQEVSLLDTGTVPGTEIAQLYLKDRYASMMRPVMELAGFARVALELGETKTVTFTVHPSQMAFLDADMQWRIEKGAIDVFVGASSNDLLLEDTISITQTTQIMGRMRKFYSGVAITGEE